MESVLYYKYLLNLLSNMEDKNDFHNELKVSIYLTLLSLNNHNYNEKYYQNEINILENYLRKINNLKVKIQLKRKFEEIDNLFNEIDDIYNNNIRIINKYNKDNINIIETLQSKDSTSITELIDSLTKEKIRLFNLKDEYNYLRTNIIDNIFNNKYYLDNNILYIDNTKISLNITDFYNIFDYLLDINNYQSPFINSEIKDLHLSLIKDIIEIITKQEFLKIKEIIPVILVHLIATENLDYMNIDMSKFNIENIKITDLYKMANDKQNTNEKVAKWKNIIISNEYLYNKTKESLLYGTYYFNNELFILENIDNNISDFKVSINVADMRQFLKESLLNIQSNIDG